MTVTTDIPTAKALRLARFAPLAAFIAVSLAVALPILMHPALPAVDLPNHIARYAIMVHPDGPLGTYYTVPDLSAVPNSAVDLLWWLTGMRGDPVRFANTIFAVYAINLVGAVMVLSRVFLGRWTVWPAVSGFLVYNAAFFWGFQNFLFSVPFALYGLALWLVTERRPLPVRLALFLPFAAVLYLMHLFAFLALAFLAFGCELRKLLDAGQAWPRQLAAGAVMALPFALPVLWMLAGSISEQGSRTEFGGIGRRYEALISPVATLTLGEETALPGIGLLGLLFLVACLLTIRARSGPRLVADRRMVMPFLVLLVASALAPHWLNGVALVQIRLPFITLAVLIAGTAWTELSPRLATLLVVLFTGLIGARSVEFERYAAMHDADIRNLATVLEDLPPGSRLLPLRAPPKSSISERLWHAQAYAVPLSQSFVPTLFQGVHALHVRPKWRDYTHPALYAITLKTAFQTPEKRPQAPGAYWRDWEHGFTHALIMDRIDPARITGQPLKELSHSGRFSLFEVTKQPDP